MVTGVKAAECICQWLPHSKHAPWMEECFGAGGMPLEDFDKAGHVMGRVCPCVWAWGQDEVGRGGGQCGFQESQVSGKQASP